MFRAILALALAVLLGCSDNLADSLVELGELEQEMSAKGSSTGITYGVCLSPYREKCKSSAGCSGGAPCMVPKTKGFYYQLVGDDYWDTPAGRAEDIWEGFRSWKEQFRRAMADLTESTNFVASEVSSGANIVIQRANVGCVTSFCDTIPDFVRFTEPTGANRVTLTESLPGSYVRPLHSTTVRTILVDVDQVETSEYLGGIPLTVDEWNHHWVLEHMAWWATFTMAGIGSRLFVTDFDVQYQGPIMSPWACVYGTDPAGVSECDVSSSQFNWVNLAEDWEVCQMNSFSTANNTTFTVATPSCVP